MSEFRWREGIQEIRTSVMRVITQNSDKEGGGGTKRGRKFGHHLWMVPKITALSQTKKVVTVFNTPIGHVHDIWPQA